MKLHECIRLHESINLYEYLKLDKSMIFYECMKLYVCRVLDECMNFIDYYNHYILFIFNLLNKFLILIIYLVDFGSTLQLVVSS